MDFWKTVPMMPLSPEKQELYTILDQIVQLHERGDITFEHMIDLIHDEIAEFKEKHTTK